MKSLCSCPKESCLRKPQEKKEKTTFMLSPLPGRPSYLSQPGLTDPKCFQMSSIALTWAPAALIIRPPHPTPTSLCTLQPTDRASPWTDNSTDDKRAAHPHQPPHLEPIRKETVREREWGGGSVKLVLAGIAVWSLLKPLPLKMPLFLCIAH